MTTKSTKNLVLKLALLGDPAVGKSSLINQYIQQSGLRKLERCINRNGKRGGGENKCDRFS